MTKLFCHLTFVEGDRVGNFVGWGFSVSVGCYVKVAKQGGQRMSYFSMSHGLYISNNENLCLPFLMATHMAIGLLAITRQITCQILIHKGKAKIN